MGADEGRQKHTPITDEETKGACEYGEHGRGRTKQHTNLRQGKLGCEYDQLDKGGRKHTFPREDKEAKVGVSIPNMDEGGRKHTLSKKHALPSDKEKGDVSTANTDEGG